MKHMEIAENMWADSPWDFSSSVIRKPSNPKVLLHGNLSRDVGIHLVRGSLLQPLGLPIDDDTAVHATTTTKSGRIALHAPRVRRVQLPPHTELLVAFANPNGDNLNSAAAVHFQVGPYSVLREAQWTLLAA